MPKRLSLVVVLGLTMAGCSSAAQSGPEPGTPVPLESKTNSDSGQGGTEVPLTPDDEVRIAAISQAITNTHAARHECWAHAAADGLAVAGKLALRLRFGSEVRAQVLIDEPDDAVLTACVVALYQSYAWPEVFEPGSAIEVPFQFEAPTSQYTVKRAHVPARNHPRGVETLTLLDRQNSGNRTVVLRQQRLSLGAVITVHARRKTTRIVYIISGQGRFRGRNNAQEIPIEAGQALFIAAGVPYGMAQRGTEPLVLMVFETPDQALDTAADVVVGPMLEQLATADTLPQLRPMPDIYSIAGGRGRVAIYFDAEQTGDPNAYLGILSAEPGVTIPLHTHPNETEVAFVLTGTAAMMVDGDRYDIDAGTALQVPPGIKHSATITGTEPLRLLQVYTPSGPEQRFKQAPPAR